MYQGQLCAETAVNVLQKASIFQQLTDRKLQAEAELNRINTAIEALAANPDLMKVLEAMNGVRFY